MKSHVGLTTSNEDCFLWDRGKEEEEGVPSEDGSGDCILNTYQGATVLLHSRPTSTQLFHELHNNI